MTERVKLGELIDAGVVRRALIGVAVLGSFLLGALWLFLEKLDHGILAQASSPSGDRVAVLHFLGEGESPGYGQQLVIRRRWVPMKEVFGEPIFRGYCKSPSSLRWTSETEFELRCSSYEEVELKRETFEGVRVTYK